jgi:hypothetical protein
MAKYPRFDDQWFYQSFCSVPGSAEGPPQIAVPWSPRGQLTVATDPETGKVSGELVFSPEVKLSVSGFATPATAKLPEGVELTAEGLGSITTLRGYFVYGAMVVVTGIVIAVRNDLAKQPIGTKGSFVIYPGVA